MEGDTTVNGTEVRTSAMLPFEFSKTPKGKEPDTSASGSVPPVILMRKYCPGAKVPLRAIASHVTFLGRHMAHTCTAQTSHQLRRTVRSG